MRIVISSCLLGHKIRYDGQSKAVELPPHLADAEVLHFCPEVAAGFGVPREPIELAAADAGDASIRVVRVRDRADVTERLAAACEKEIARLKADGIRVDLFVLKSNSPSCGPAAPVRDANGTETGRAPGIWAATIRKHFHDTPVMVL